MIYTRRVVRVLGVNSELADGLHIPMIEYDNITARELLAEVKNLQDKFHLGEAVISSTGRYDSYHVYFMTRLPWRDCIMVYASSTLSDLKHLHFSLQRGHFTLRVTPKGKRKIESFEIVSSDYPNTATLEDLKSWVGYETAVKK